MIQKKKVLNYKIGNRIFETLSIKCKFIAKPLSKPPLFRLNFNKKLISFNIKKKLNSELIRLELILATSKKWCFSN